MFHVWTMGDDEFELCFLTEEEAKEMFDKYYSYYKSLYGMPTYTDTMYSHDTYRYTEFKYPNGVLILSLY